MYYRRAGLAVATLLACTLSTARADTLEMPSEQAPTSPPSEPAEAFMELPAKGRSMAQVTERFGEPLEKIGPVGDPPISRWVYDEYTVYFEGKYVIHTVLNRN